MTIERTLSEIKSTCEEIRRRVASLSSAEQGTLPARVSTDWRASYFLARDVNETLRAEIAEQSLTIAALLEERDALRDENARLRDQLDGGSP